MKKEPELSKKCDEYREEYDDVMEFKPISKLDYIEIMPVAIIVAIVYFIIWLISVIFLEIYELFRRFFHLFKKT